MNLDNGTIYNNLEKEIKSLKDELNFYKSLFKTHNNSAVFNLKIKKKKGKNIWIDLVNEKRANLLELDKDDEIDERLKPIKCER